MSPINYTNEEVNSFSPPLKCCESTVKYLKKVDSKHLKVLCKKYVPFWEDLEEEEIELSTITLCKNSVYIASLPKPDYRSKRLKKVLIRVIPEEKRVLYDIDYHNEVSTLLGNNNFGPKIISIFPGGRIEEWIEGFVLHSSSLFNLSVLTSVATLLAKFHKTITTVAPKEWDRSPSLLSKMEEWLPECRRINESLKLELDMDKMESYFHDYKSYLEDYLSKLDMPEYNDFPGTNGDESERSKLTDEELKRQGSNYANRVLFCHNDLHLKNLIATYDGLTLIDFEYSSFNYVGADIGYFFSTSSLNFDYDLNEYIKYDKTCELSYDLKANFASVYLSESLGETVLPSRKDIIEPFLDSVEVYLLGTILFWAMWPILM
ncbi:choline kinase [Theileria orientalis strain Shintoku]|uniref:Choline kinase n=1 Tax=Theileria orientalis strain Shintoku TaxID=869250 RepID=J4C7H4_THEOR|nr:choline kinase [Theileria orientalis strain Shintoku]BAM39043.1 choline kinase [Theileria orientalis strain Shintoku]|eukprot:XP_009689344.1 choline kinase [Theileria orientalis strain Shintoku]